MKQSKGEIDRQRKRINRDQSALRSMLTRHPDRAALDRFLAHHAALHTASADWPDVWSYEDALLDGLPEVAFRVIPKGQAHSIAWVLWHATRIEDAAMNLVVGGRPQVLLSGDWPKRLGVQARDSGNEWRPGEIETLSRSVEIPALRAYRKAVGVQTRELVAGLSPADLTQKTDPGRLQLVMQVGALAEAAAGIRDYWSRRTIAGMLLMPGSRHILTHLNEIFDMRKKIAPW